MKRLIVDEVQTFRAEVRQQARAGGQIRRQDRFVSLSVLLSFVYSHLVLMSAYPSPPARTSKTRPSPQVLAALPASPCKASALAAPLPRIPVRNSRRSSLARTSAVDESRPVV